jgi:hypothetical protein
VRVAIYFFIFFVLLRNFLNFITPEIG